MAIARERDQALDVHAALGNLIAALSADTSPDADQAIAWLRGAQRVLSTFAGDPRNRRKRAAAQAVMAQLTDIVHVAEADAAR